MFGGSTSQASSGTGGLFGSVKPAASTGGLFGSASGSSGGIFGSAPTSSTGLFGAKPAEKPSEPDKSESKPVGGLFGSSNKEPETSKPLVEAKSEPKTEAVKPAASTGNLFGSSG